MQISYHPLVLTPKKTPTTRKLRKTMSLLSSCCAAPVPLLCHALCLRRIIPSGIARQHAHQTPTTHRYLLVTKWIPSPHLPQRHRQVRRSDAKPTTKYHILIPNRPTNQASIQTATATVTAASENIKPTALHTTHDTRHTSLNPFLSRVSIYCH